MCISVNTHLPDHLISLSLSLSLSLSPPLFLPLPPLLQLKLIRTNALMYLSEITQLLDTVPRQLVLILKTNDLLRSADHVLQASNHKQSFLTMSKCCLQAIGDYDARRCTSWVGWVCVRVGTTWSVLRITLYEVWLRYGRTLGLAAV